MRNAMLLSSKCSNCLFFCASLGVALPLPGAAQGSAASLAPPAAYVRANPGSRVLALRHGQWFDGRRFRPRTFYLVNGLLQRRRPARLDSVVDLAGQWVVPAFGDAHNHALDQEWRAPETIARNLANGVFYLKNPNNIPALTVPLAPVLNRPASLDVRYSGGGITGSGGHPIPLYEGLMARGAYRLSKAELNGQAYHVLDSLAQWPAVWARVRAGNPDFVKLYLLYSEHYGRPRDTATTPSAGLNPRLFAEVVRRVHAQGLPVAVHIETAADFAVAVRAGADEINHLPGYFWNKGLGAEDYRISETLARQCARQGTRVVTTTVVTADEYPAARDSARLRQVRRLQVENLRRLHRAGVRLALGCDTYDQTARAEAVHLWQLRVFDAATLLHLWSETTPQAIFPGRQVGRLAPGYEANLLVLGRNPLTTDFATATAAIRLRIKQGNVLRGPAAAAAAQPKQ